MQNWIPSVLHLGGSSPIAGPLSRLKVREVRPPKGQARTLQADRLKGVRTPEKQAPGKALYKCQP